MLQHQRVLGHKHPRSSAKNFIIRRLHLEQRTPSIHPSAPQIYWYRRIWMRDSHLPEKEWIDLPSARLDAGGYLRGVVVASGEESAIGPPVWPTLCRPQMNSDTDRSVQRLVSFELCLHSRLLVFPHSYHCYEEHPTLKVVPRDVQHSKRWPTRCYLDSKVEKSPGQKAFIKILVCAKLSCLRIWC